MPNNVQKLTQNLESALNKDKPVNSDESNSIDNPSSYSFSIYTCEIEKKIKELETKIEGLESKVRDSELKVSDDSSDMERIRESSQPSIPEKWPVEKQWSQEWSQVQLPPQLPPYPFMNRMQQHEIVLPHRFKSLTDLNISWFDRLKMW